METHYASKTVKVNGLEMHYQEWGHPDAPPLVMVHGLNRQSHDFDPVAERLRKNFRCISVDVRGHGENAHGEPEKYTFGNYAKDMAAFHQALELGPVHYLGTSLGGHVGLMLAARAPEMFKSLVLNDIAPEIVSKALGSIEAGIGSTPESFEDMEAYVKYAITRNPWLKDRTPQEQHARARWSVQEREDGRLVTKFDPRILGGKGLADPEALKKSSLALWAGFKGLKCPIMLVWGEESNLLSPEVVERMLAAQPTMKVAKVPGVGHAPTLTEPEVITAFSSFYGGFS